MIANITSGNSFTGLVMYNEKKVHKGKAVRLSSYTIPLNSSSNQIIELLETVGNKNPNIENKTFHVSIAFAQTDQVNETYLSNIAHEYMQEMGFVDVPYMVYNHYDTGINHMHIVSTRVNFDGKKINDSFERFKSQRVSRKLELKHNLTVVPSVKDYKITKEPTLNSDGSANTKHQISTAIYDVLHQHKVTNFEDFNLMLAKKKIVVDYVKTKKNGESLITPGLLYSIGYKTTPETKRIKGSAFHHNYTYKNVIEILNRNLLKEQSVVIEGRSKDQLNNLVKQLIVQLKAPAVTSTEQLDIMLAKHNLKAVYLSNSGGIYGLKIVDLISNLEYKASDLNRGFSWNAIKDYLANSQVTQLDRSSKPIPFVINQPINDGDKKIIWVTKIPNKTSIAAPIKRITESLHARGFVTQIELNNELKSIGYKAHFSRDLSVKGNEIQAIAFTNIKTGQTYSGNNLDFKNLSWNILKDFVANDNHNSTFESYVNNLYRTWSNFSNIKNENVSDYLNYLNHFGVTIEYKAPNLCYKQINGDVRVNVSECNSFSLSASLIALHANLKSNGFNQFPLSPIDRRFVNAIYLNDGVVLKELIKNGNRINLAGIKLADTALTGIQTYKSLVNTQSQLSKTLKFVAYCITLNKIKGIDLINDKIDFTTYITSLNKRGIGVSFKLTDGNIIHGISYFNRDKSGLLSSDDLPKFLNDESLSKFIDFTTTEDIKKVIDLNNGFMHTFTANQIALVNAIENNNEQQEIKLISEGTYINFTPEELNYFEIDDNYFDSDQLEDNNVSKQVIESVGNLISDLLLTTQGENPINRGGAVSKEKRKKPRYRRR